VSKEKEGLMEKALSTYKAFQEGRERAREAAERESVEKTKEEFVMLFFLLYKIASLFTEIHTYDMCVRLEFIKLLEAFGNYVKSRYCDYDWC